MRVQTADGELFFLHTTLLPEDPRILLRSIDAIRETRASPANAGDAGSLVDERDPAGGLLDQGLLTGDEFDQVKARADCRRGISGSAEPLQAGAVAVGEGEGAAVAGEHGHLVVARGRAGRCAGTTPGASLVSHVTSRSPTVRANCSRWGGVTYQSTEEW